MKPVADPKSFVVIRPHEVQCAAVCLTSAIRHVRLLGQLPLKPHADNGSPAPGRRAEQEILNAARAMGIDLGAALPGQLDVSDAP